MVTQGLEFLGDQLFRLAGQCGTLKKHGVDFFIQGSGGPSFDAAHLDVEFAFERIVEVNQALEVGPGQLSPQRGDNLLVRKGLGKPNHVPKRFF